jgi:alanyl-tRNA synthetase
MLVGNLIDGLDNHVIAISSIDADKIAFAVAVSKDLQSRFQAGKLVGDMAKVTGGGGGGRPDLATAGGRDASKLDDAFAILRTTIK